MGSLGNGATSAAAAAATRWAQNKRPAFNGSAEFLAPFQLRTALSGSAEPFAHFQFRIATIFINHRKQPKLRSSTLYQRLLYELHPK